MWSSIKQLLPGFSLVSTLIVCGVLVFFYALYSGGETGLYRLNRLRLHLACRSGNRRALILDRLFDEPQVLISVFVTGANICGYLIASLLTLYFRQSGLSSAETEFWSTVILTPVFAILCETLPKNCFYGQANRLMLWSAPFIRVSYLTMRYLGLTYVVGFFSQFAVQLARYFGRTTAASGDWDDYGTLIREGLAAGQLSVVQGGIAERLLQLPEIPLSRVIIPLPQTVAFPVDISRDEFVKQIRKHRYSRYPLYRGSPRNIVGIVSIYQVLTSDPGKQPQEFLRIVPRIPVDQKLMAAMEIMRERSSRMAVVVDRFGSTIGIVTIRDLLGEILSDLD